MKSFTFTSSASTSWWGILLAWSAFSGLFSVLGFECWHTSNAQWNWLANQNPHHWTRSYPLTFALGAAFGLAAGVLHVAARGGRFRGLTRRQDPPPITLTDDAAGTTDLRLKKRRIIRMLFGYSVIWGVIIYFLPEEDVPEDVLLGLPFAFLGAGWCMADAQERGQSISRILRILLVLAFIIGFPIYAFRSRGVHGSRLILSGVVVAGSMFACAFAAGHVTSMVCEAFGLWGVQ